MHSSTTRWADSIPPPFELGELLHADRSKELRRSQPTLFENPSYFLLFRRLVVPLLRNHVQPRLWIAGCPSPHELYSYCILLEEEGLGRHCTIHVTDPEGSVLEQARCGTLASASLQHHEYNYQEAGGRRRLESHFDLHGGKLELKPSMLEGVAFDRHDPAVDGPLGEFQAISCRDVLSRSDSRAQVNILAALHGSLCLCGHLGLGRGESLPNSLLSRNFRSLSGSEPLYQRIR